MSAAIGRRRLLLLAPLGAAALGGVAFWTMLERMQSGQFDPHAIGDPLLGHPVPEFDLPPMPPGPGFSAAALRAAAARGPVLVNFFASWCIPCVQEADLLAGLAQRGLPVWGIAYKDRPAACAAFLARNGNPYARLADDAAGRTGIDFGIYGVPESFLIDHAGRIAWHLAGPVSQEIIERQLTPAVKRLQS